MDSRVSCKYKNQLIIPSKNYDQLLSISFSYEIRLGEHRISTEKDCRNQGRKPKCAPPVVDVGIEKHLIHEQYDTRHYHNDIALLRLNESVTFQSKRSETVPWSQLM